MSSPLLQHQQVLAALHGDDEQASSSDDNLDREASPLGDYLADAESSFEPFESPFTPKPYDNDATIIARRRRTRKTPSFMRSAQQPSPILATRPLSLSPLDDDDDDDDDAPVAGPSRLPMETKPQRPEDAAFEERFKYMIATSGLLEKTQLDRGGSSRRAESERESRPASPTMESSPSTDTPKIVIHKPASTESRWNLLTTVGVVAFGITCVLAGASSVVGSTALAAGFVLLKPHDPIELDSDDDYDDVEALDEDDMASSPDSVYASLPSSPAPPATGADLVFTSLESLLTKSRVLDQTITSSLQILAPAPDDTGHAHDLRIALHRLLDDMTDSLATCTSTLIPLADRTELSVLGDMYDIPVLGPRRLRRHSYGDRDHIAVGRSAPSTTLMRDDSSALPSSPFDPNERFTKLPDRTMRQRRMSTGVDWAAPPSAYRPPRPEDSIPEHSIPESNDEETGSESMMSTSDSGSVPASLPEVVGQQTSPSRSRPLSFAPKRASPLAQALERLEGAPGASSLASSPPFPVMHTRVLSQASSSSSSYRRSLQDIRYIPSSPPSSSDAAANLALARASANLSSANRRSLQMPLHPHEMDVLEQAINTEGANLHRARSLPHSQRSGLRPLATATSPGSKRSSIRSDRTNTSSKRLSVVCDVPAVTSTHSSPATSSYRRNSLLLSDYNRPSGDASSLGYGLAPNQLSRPSRISSVSPLTLGGLKAAYLGVHLKRRRVACCLLGLRFFSTQQVEDDYWTHICEALNDLGNEMSAASERLESIRAEADKELQAARALSGAMPMTPPPQYSLASPIVTQPTTDFAPRDTTEQALLANVDELQRTLARVWARCDEMRSRLASGEADTLADTWSEVRTDIGGLLRHVERGRELARREDRDSIDEEDETEETSTPPMPMPEFLRAWADPGPAELERVVDDNADDSDPEDLPLPGIDEVFEADVPAAAPRAKSTMSREERIALTREARARGMTLAQLTAKSPEEQEKERQRQLTADRLRAESDMISELEGMFGAIRRRKGMD